MATVADTLKNLAVKYHGEDYAMSYLWGLSQDYIPEGAMDMAISNLEQALELRAERERQSLVIDLALTETEEI